MALHSIDSAIFIDSESRIIFVANSQYKIGNRRRSRYRFAYRRARLKLVSRRRRTEQINIRIFPGTLVNKRIILDFPAGNFSFSRIDLAILANSKYGSVLGIDSSTVNRYTHNESAGRINVRLRTICIKVSGRRKVYPILTDSSFIYQSFVCDGPTAEVATVGIDVTPKINSAIRVYRKIARLKNTVV